MDCNYAVPEIIQVYLAEKSEAKEVGMDCYPICRFCFLNLEICFKNKREISPLYLFIWHQISFTSKIFTPLVMF